VAAIFDRFVCHTMAIDNPKEGFPSMKYMSRRQLSLLSCPPATRPRSFGIAIKIVYSVFDCFNSSVFPILLRPYNIMNSALSELYASLSIFSSCSRLTNFCLVMIIIIVLEIYKGLRGYNHKITQIYTRILYVVPRNPSH